MPRKERDQSGGNEGIQADQVTAHVMAVGRGARATSYENAAPAPSEPLAQQIAHVERVLAQLIQDQRQYELLREELTELRALTTGKAGASSPPEQSRDEARSVLERFGAKLKMTNVVVSEVAALVTPITAIANALSVPLRLFGIG